MGYSFGLAYGWDLNWMLFKLMGEGDFNGSAFFTSAGLGAEVLPHHSATSRPYLAADFGGGLAKVDQSLLAGQTIGGFVVGVGGGGSSCFGPYAINLDLNFRMGFLLHENDLGDPHVSTRARPSDFTF